MDNLTDLPNSDGFFGEYGGKFVPETLMHALKELDETYGKLKNSPKFIEEIDQDLIQFVATPCCPAPVSAIILFLPIAFASNICPTVLFIL